LLPCVAYIQSGNCTEAGGYTIMENPLRQNQIPG
jgi:hypothetical protein